MAKRLSNLPTIELTMWAENSLFTIGRNVAGSGKKGFEEYSEALVGAYTLVYVLEELIQRTKND